MASRRTFLKVGAGASLALALGGGIYRATQATRAAAPLPPFALDGEARAALHAIAPALLAGVRPAVGTAAFGTVIDAVHRAILILPLATQKEIQDLFGLLAMAPMRRLLTGIAGGWSNASRDDVHTFLQDWRVSQFGMLRAGYAALHDLVLGAWYAAPASWDAIGYPGPPLAVAP